MSVGILLNTGGNICLKNYIHDNKGLGIDVASGPSTGSTILNNIVSRQTGANGIGIRWDYGSVVMNNIVNNCDSHGMTSREGYFFADIILNNIVMANGGFGIKWTAVAGLGAYPEFDGNLFWNNTSGPRNNMDDTTINVLNGVAPYNNIYDIYLSSTNPSPLVNAAANDYRLNNIVNSGASGHMSGPFNKPFMGLPFGVVGYGDFGPLQSREIVRTLSYNGGYNN